MVTAEAESTSLLANPPTLHYARPEEGALALRFAGDWLMCNEDLPLLDRLKEEIQRPEKPIKHLKIELQDVGEWDTSLVAMLYSLFQACKKTGGSCEWQGAPEGVMRLLELVTQRTTLATADNGRQAPLLERLGKAALSARQSTEDVLDFVGQVTLSFGRLFKHKAYFRHRDFLSALADVGPRALPIVTLISFLVGLILAFVGSMQLETFGAQIFVADLVGVAMAREMGAMMTGIIMAGRTAASYAARLGTMQVNEEIDAMQTNGINAMDFLTLPRVLALLLMVPFLCLYANVVGIAGGMTIGVFMLDLAPIEYWNQTLQAVSINDFSAGLMKGFVFAAVVGLCGCYHGLRCGRSSEAVGKVTTVAVVSAIVFIIITDSILTVVYDIINF